MWVNSTARQFQVENPELLVIHQMTIGIQDELETQREH